MRRFITLLITAAAVLMCTVLASAEPIDGERQFRRSLVQPRPPASTTALMDAAVADTTALSDVSVVEPTSLDALAKPIDAVSIDPPVARGAAPVAEAGEPADVEPPVASGRKPFTVRPPVVRW